MGRTGETAQGDFGPSFFLTRNLKCIGVYSFLGMSSVIYRFRLVAILISKAVAETCSLSPPEMARDIASRARLHD